MAAEKKRSRARKGTATRTESATAKSKGAAGGTPKANGHEPDATRLRTGTPAAPADTSALPDEPPPSLIPPDVQAELDKLIRVNRQLRAALRSLLEDE
jgi:hypothetical protein